MNRVRMAGRVETRTHHRGEHKGVPPVPVGERVEVGDVDINGFAGFDVGDFLLEDVRTVLNQQARLVALFPRRVVDDLGFFPLPQDAANGTLPDDHQEPGDRGFLRQGKDIDGLDLRVKGVGKLLFDTDRADMAGDGGVHGRVLQGQRHLCRISGFICGRNLRHQCPGAGVLGVFIG